MSGGSAAQVVAEDLDAIVGDLSDELERLSGKRLLLTGGAGFLGHYLVQAILRANEEPGREPTRLTVFDNYVRGVPAWLQDLAGNEHLVLVEHDIRTPLPADMDDFEFVVHAAGIASPTYYRQHPIETMDANVDGLRSLLDWSVRQAERGTRSRGSSSSRAARSTAIRCPSTSRRPRPIAAMSPAPALEPVTTSRSATARPSVSTSPSSTGFPCGSRAPSTTTAPA